MEIKTHTYRLFRADADGTNCHLADCKLTDEDADRINRKLKNSGSGAQWCKVK